MQYSDLSAKLRDAADYVAENPVEVATRSLRSISASSGVSPATFSRLARALGFETYEDMRELSRAAVGHSVVSFSERAGHLQANAGQSLTILERQTDACQNNISSLTRQIDRERLDGAVTALQHARNVVLFGGFGSAGIADYLGYLANYFATNWSIAGRTGAALSTALTDLSSQDVFLVITKAPYAKRAILATEIAHEQGVDVIVITDSHACPALKYANHGFIIPSDSPQFFSSYAATLVLLESMVAMLVSRSAPEARARIHNVEAHNARLQEFWAD